MRLFGRVLGVGLVSALLIAAPVGAGQPQMEKFPGADVYVDPFLSDACGVEVTAHVTGHYIVRTFTDANDNPVREVNNYAFSITWTSVNGSVSAKDVGADRITLNADGSIVVFIIGSVQSISIPGQGRVYQDVGRTMLVITFDANGEPSFEVTPLGGKHDTNVVEAICSVLG